MTPLERLLGALRPGLLARPRRGGSSRTLLDDAALFSSCDRATDTAAGALAAAQSAGATAQQQRSALEAAADRAAALGQRGRDVRAAATGLREALDRLKLVALNAALDGSRAGDAAGAAVTLLATEVRALVARAIEVLEEQHRALDAAESDREKLGAELAEARAIAARLAEELLRAQAAGSDASSAIGTVGSNLRRALGTDPEVAAAAAQAAEHARGLVEALSTLSLRAPGGLVVRALRPSMEPLLRVLRELDGRDGGAAR